MPQNYDVAILGAGIVGAACAAALAEAGGRVITLDAARPGGGATAEGMGHIVVMDDSDAQFALTHRSQVLWDALDLPAAAERTASGTVWVATNERENEEVQRKHREYAARGVTAEILDQAALRAAEPNLSPRSTGGLLVPGDSVVYPPVAAEWLLDRAAARGASSRFDARVTRIDADAVHFVTSGSSSTERIQCKLVVAAAGIATLDLLPTPVAGLTIRPRKGHLLITDRYPGFCNHQLIELGYLDSAHGHDESAVAFNAQPRATGQVLLGSSRQFGTTSRAVEPEIVDRMVARALEYMPGLAALRITRSWTGFRAATEDHLPVIGPHPEHPSILLATGHEGLGITTSLGTAELIADHVFGREGVLEKSAYDALRFRGVA